MIARSDIGAKLSSGQELGEDDIARWLEGVIADGWDIGQIAQYLGIDRSEVGNLISQYLDNKALKRIFFAQKALLRAEVLSRGSMLVRTLTGIVDNKDATNSEKIKAADVLSRLADLKDFDVEGLTDAQDNSQSEAVLERFEVLSELIGQEALGSTGKGEDSPELAKPEAPQGSNSDSQQGHS